MQKYLFLFMTTGRISGYHTVFVNLCNMSSHHLPAFNLSGVILMSSSHIITTVPLKPSAWIVRVFPEFFFPDSKTLTGKNLKKIKVFVCRVSYSYKFRIFPPIHWKFFRSIRKIFPSKNSHSQHLFWCEIRRKI